MTDENTEKYKMIDAKVICDTQFDLMFQQDRLITIVTYAPKFLDAEIEKHGNIATNSSSSRALGFPATKRQKESFIPPVIQKPTGTMYGSQEVDLGIYNSFNVAIDELAQYSNSILGQFKDHVHKQHLNRYIEPWTMQTKVMTANLYAWQNFINLRRSRYADPSIQVLAQIIDEAIYASIPNTAKYHIPMIKEDTIANIGLLDSLKVSAGRVAKVSYDTLYDVEDCYSTSIKRADMLIDLGHKTPLEHQLLPPTLRFEDGITHVDVVDNVYSGRIRNAVQFRKLVWHGLDETKKPQAWRYGSE